MTDLARLEHWESEWKRMASVRSVSRFNYYDSRLRAVFASQVKDQCRVLEVGCGGSKWIPYFDSSLRCETWGIDYSPEGIALTRNQLPELARCRLIRGDFFDRDSLPSGYFDLVYSMGFIEHFEVGTAVTKRLTELLRQGGKAITIVPNFVGPYGRLQKLVDGKVYEKHVVMRRQDLDRVHEDAGLHSVRPATYFGCFAPGVVNCGILSSKLWGLGRFISPAIRGFQQSVCWTAWLLHLDLESEFASPYILGIYQKM
jgi:SAM-dependent methyltransferase